MSAYLDSACDKKGFDPFKSELITFRKDILPLGLGSLKRHSFKLYLPVGEPSDKKLDQYLNNVCLSIT